MYVLRTFAQLEYSAFCHMLIIYASLITTLLSRVPISCNKEFYEPKNDTFDYNGYKPPKRKFIGHKWIATEKEILQINRNVSFTDF